MSLIKDDNDVVEIEDVSAVKSTDKALLCLVNGKETWVPFSVIDDDSEVSIDGDEGTLVVKQWFAFNRGLI